LSHGKTLFNPISVGTNPSWYHGASATTKLKTNLNEYGPYSVTNNPDCGNDFTQIPIEGDFSKFLRSNIILDDTVGREDWIIGFQVPSK